MHSIGQSNGQVGIQAMDQPHVFYRSACYFSNRAVTFNMVTDQLGKPTAQRVVGTAGATSGNGKIRVRLCGRHTDQRGCAQSKE